MTEGVSKKCLEMGKPKTFPKIKICVVGDKNVGKYALGQQFANGWIQPREDNSK